jgi:hypothetical protein
MDEEHSILPSIGMMRVIKAAPSCQRLVQLTEARCKDWRPEASLPGAIGGSMLQLRGRGSGIAKSDDGAHGR